MTPEQIIEIARQASEIQLNLNPAFNDFLTRFSQLVRNAALEEAAQVCDVNHHTVKRNPDSFECAAGIRSLKS